MKKINGVGSWHCEMWLDESISEALLRIGGEEAQLVATPSPRMNQKRTLETECAGCCIYKP